MNIRARANTAGFGLFGAALILLICALDGCYVKQTKPVTNSASAKGSAEVTTDNYPVVIANLQMLKGSAGSKEYTDIIISGTAEWAPAPGDPADSFNSIGVMEFELLDARGSVVARLQNTFDSVGIKNDPSKILPNKPFPFVVSELKPSESAKNIISCRFTGYVTH